MDSHTRVCKICNKEKPIEDFSRKGRGYYNTKCKVCESLLKKNIDYSSTEWTLEEDRILTGFIINNKGEIINGLVDTLNKDLKTICTRISELRFHTKLTIKVNCEYCGKEMFVTPYRILNYGSICCSKGCNSKLKKGINYHKIINKGSCVNCNKEFDVYDNVPDQKFCSSSCKHQYYSKNDLNRAKTQCANCGKEILKNKSQIRNYNNNYCSLECEKEFKHKQSHEKRICEICGKEYECMKICTQRFCSNTCQGVWQSQYLVGENANGYNHNYSIEDRTFTCEYCGKETVGRIYNIESRRFCSDICRQKWYAEDFSQTKEWREKSKIRAVKILEDGLVSKTNSGCQNIVNNILNSLNINFKNEKGFKYFAVDNYLSDYNLIIEVMGTYWHCDHRKYEVIPYERQIDRIRRDKAKHTYIKNNYNINILYLWEDDINNIDLICNLITIYINNNGVLKNYHSFNYYLNLQNILELNSEIAIPYMDYEAKDLNKIIDIKTKVKMSKKQLDKWISYKCNWCEKDCEELISHYNKHITHCCSRECSLELKKFNHKNIL